MTKLFFKKMHGLGNDFVIIDRRNNFIDLSPQIISHLADRKFGIGCDQVILIDKSTKADCKMLIFNQDGNSAEACGNGARCVAYLLMQEKKVNNATLETGSKILQAKLIAENTVEVNMGKPKTNWQDIPLISAMDTNNIDLEIDDLKNPIAINIGNPHLIFFVNELDDLEIDEIGKSLENHYYFPNKINVNFAKIENRNLIKLITFERGVGLTLACGSGACATAYAAWRKNLVETHVQILQSGGNLDITINDDHFILMRGKIATSFSGTTEI